ncbi:Protein RhsC [bioreactor metagenome]|uniref:Protein RhsC n=1 Tax=bioreactor metagenome TaxID=1076179 RepID=A0A644Y4L5_9ZZZZ
MGLHSDDRRNTSFFFVANDVLGPWWILGPQPPQGDITGRRLALLGLNDRFGRTQRIGRDAQGRMNVVQDGSGRQYRLELKTLPGIANEGAHGWGADSGVRLAAVYLTHDPHHADVPQQPLVRYDYSAHGELTAVFGRDGSLLRRFQYHPQMLGRMTAHAYAGRSPVTYVYNEQGKVVEQIRQGALSYRFDYHEDSTTVIDSMGRESVYYFEGEAGLCRLVKMRHPDGSIAQDRFDASGRQTASIDALGRETQYDRDVATGRLLCITQHDGLQSRFNYNAQGQIEQSIRENGASDHYAYDPLGRLASVTNALGNTTRYRYADDSSEQPSIIIDARGGEKLCSWNQLGQLISYTDCSGSVTRYRYDRFGQLIQTLGEEGTSFQSEYDARGRLIASTDALKQTTIYDCNEAGDLTRITAPNGNVVQFERDVQGQLKVYHYSGYTQQFDYDEAGRLTRLINENGAQTTFEYDVMDRLTRQVNFDGRMQQYQFNAVGDLLRSDDEGRISHYHYDKGGRLLKLSIGEGDECSTEHFGYTEDGQLAKAWHTSELGGNTITVAFERDLLGRITRETQGIVGSDGSDVWQHSVDREFDELGNEVQTAYMGLPAIEWQTYGSGHLHGVMIDGKSIIDFERDKLHREISRQFGATKTTRSYDALSRLSLLHTRSPLIGEGEAFKRLHHYDAAGQLTRIDTPRGAHEYGYDMVGRLIAVSQLGLEKQRYRFDPAGNRLFENTGMGTKQENWEETVRQHARYQYFNLLGENAEMDSHNTAQKWMDNRITDDGEYHYEYDAWGNLRRKYKAEGNEQHHYHYDSKHRLIRFELESDTVVRGANYHYDPFGRRVAKQVQEADAEGHLKGELQTTFFGWDGDRLILTEKDKRQTHTIYEPGSFVPMISINGDKAPPRGTLAQKLLAYGSTIDRKSQVMLASLESELREGRLSAISRQWMQQVQLRPETLEAILDEASSLNGKKIYLSQCDHMGTPLALIDPEGKIAWAARVDPWGGMLQEYNPENLDQSIRLQGQHWDEECELHYNRYRYYQQELGRYVTQDPIGVAGGINWYKYPLNPNEGFDPLGLQDWGSIPIFNGGLPGNQAALSTAMAGGAPVSTGGFLGAMGDKITQGVQIGPSVGGTAVAVVGVSASAGTTTDQTGLTCVTSTVCGIIGPMIGGFSSAGYAAQTGKVSPGDVGWSIGGIGAATIGPGGKAELSIGTDGAIGVQGGGALGGAIGGALQICRQVTTKTCTSANKQ